MGFSCHFLTYRLIFFCQPAISGTVQQMDTLWILIAVLVVMVIGALAAGYMFLKRSTGARFPYSKNPHFLTPAEQDFFRLLEQIIQSQYYIFCQVNLLSLVSIAAKNRQDYWQHARKLRHKSIDFVLADKRTLEPVLLIELDDYSHQLAERRTRDNFVNQTLATAGFKFLRIENRRYYDILEIQELIYQSLDY